MIPKKINKSPILPFPTIPPFFNRKEYFNNSDSDSDSDNSNKENYEYFNTFDSLNDCNYNELKSRPNFTNECNKDELVSKANIILRLENDTNNTGNSNITVTTIGFVGFTQIENRNCVYFKNSMNNYLKFKYCNTEKFTICYWVYVIDNKDYTALSISSGNFNTPDPVFQTDFYIGSQICNFVALPNRWTVTKNDYNYVGKWVHVAYTCDQTTFKIQLFVNGILASTANGSNALNTHVNTYIMGRSGDSLRSFNGYITQFYKFNFVLSPCQVKNIYEITNTPIKTLTPNDCNYNEIKSRPIFTNECNKDGLVSKANIILRLENDTNNTGNSNITVRTIGSVGFTQIENRNCVYFKNSITNYLKFKYCNTEKFTICYWVYVIDNINYTALSICSGNFKMNDPVFQTDFYIGSQIRNSVALPNRWTMIKYDYNYVGRWTHVAYTCDQTTFKIQLFVNGIFVDSSNGTNALKTHVNTYIMGKSGDNGRAFNGYITQFYKFNFVLSPCQIKNIYEITDTPLKTRNLNDCNYNEIYSRPIFRSECSKNEIVSKANIILELENNTINAGNSNITVTTVGSVGFTKIDNRSCVYFKNSMNNYLKFKYCNTEKFTICYWIYVIDDRYYTALSISSDNFNRNNPVFQADFNNGSQICNFVALPNPWTMTKYDYNYVGKWTHVAYTCDQTTLKIQLFVNGIFVSTATGSNALKTHVNTYIMGRSGDNGRAFNGYITQFYKFNFVLSPCQIKNMYEITDTPQRTSTLNDCNFNEINSRPIFRNECNKDEIVSKANIILRLDNNTNNTGNSNINVTTVGSVGFTQIDGKDCVSFKNSMNDYLKFKYCSTQKFTVCYWVYVIDNRYYTSLSISSGNFNMNNPVFQTDFINGSQIGNFVALPNPWTVTKYDYNYVGKWTHVAYTCDQTTFKIQLFVNGNLVNNATGTNALRTTDVNTYIIGRSGDSSRAFNGYIAQFYKFNFVLSPCQVKNMYEITNIRSPVNPSQITSSLPVNPSQITSSRPVNPSPVNPSPVKKSITNPVYLNTVMPQLNYTVYPNNIFNYPTNMENDQNFTSFFKKFTNTDLHKLLSQTPISLGVVSNIGCNNDPTNFDTFYKTKGNRKIAVKYNGYLSIDKPGEYIFYLQKYDNGNKLLLNSGITIIWLGNNANVADLDLDINNYTFAYTELHKKDSTFKINLPKGCIQISMLFIAYGNNVPCISLGILPPGIDSKDVLKKISFSPTNYRLTNSDCSKKSVIVEGFKNSPDKNEDTFKILYSIVVLLIIILFIYII